MMISLGVDHICPSEPIKNGWRTNNSNAKTRFFNSPIGTLLLASLLILPIQAGTLETTPQSRSLTWGESTRGSHSTTFLSWKDTAVSSYPLSTEEFSTMSTSSSDDSNNMEVGIEWINWDYGGDDLHTDDCAKGFYNTLGGAGWTKEFNCGEDLAWEKDFEKSSVGGWDSIYVDDADFVMFAGHGDEGLIQFSTNYDGDGSYEEEVHYSETKWGDGDLEWMTLVSCDTLHPDVKDEWIAHACAGNHLHALMGFKNKVEVEDVEYLGTTFANYLLDGKGIKDAWKTATIEECERKWYFPDTYAAIIYPRVYFGTRLVHNYAQETFPNEGNYIGTDPSYFTAENGYSVAYYYDSWNCG